MQVLVTEALNLFHCFFLIFSIYSILFQISTWYHSHQPVVIGQLLFFFLIFLLFCSTKLISVNLPNQFPDLFSMRHQSFELVLMRGIHDAPIIFYTWLLGAINYLLRNYHTSIAKNTGALRLQPTKSDRSLNLKVGSSTLLQGPESSCLMLIDILYKCQHVVSMGAAMSK